MLIRAYIFTYDRPEMVKEVYERLDKHDIDISIIDDGTEPELTLPNVKRHNHRGKRGFWLSWHEVLQDCRDNPADLYIFTVDDFSKLDVQGIKRRHRKLTRKGAYVHNIINDGRNDKCWTKIRPVKLNQNLWHIGWTDCAFFCNREALDRIGYYMHSPQDNWFNLRENISSGVGMMLTKRLNEARVHVYRPEYSLAHHGDHESKMHTEHRKTKKLISK